MNLDDALQTFFAECRELLIEMEDALLVVLQSEPKEELVNAIFRAAHTIKGSAGLFGLDHIVAFTHVVESVLDRVRDGKLPVTESLVSLLLGCCDQIGRLAEAVAAGHNGIDEQLQSQGAPLLAQLSAYLDSPAPKALPVTAITVSADPVERIAHAGIDADHWHISIRFGADVLRNGMDPLSFLRYLATMGSIVGIATLADSIPDAGNMDPESCYLGFEIAFRTGADKATIESVF
ncbi:Signal transduction histidine kinase CheA [Oxalobacteraceae bacterium IMCC9480]|nr:Signal transduction histidine kinase CheA [Oxalobacteraceae bacterium IMCC9480]